MLAQRALAVFLDQLGRDQGLQPVAQAFLEAPIVDFLLVCEVDSFFGHDLAPVFSATRAPRISCDCASLGIVRGCRQACYGQTG